MSFLRALVVLAAGLGGLAAWCPLAYAEPVYRYCMIGTPNLYTDCSFNTLQQCQITASSGAGFCQESNAYVAARDSAAAVRAVPLTRSRR